MSKLRVACFSISLDGYGAGPRQDMDNPLGVGGFALHDWFLPTRTFKRMQGEEGGTTGIDDDFAARGFGNVGASILGRNMFGPVRGPWPDDTWKGWWGNEPPYHVPVFVLTHHPRPPIQMKGGTTFHFVTGGIEAALKQAREAAAGKDVRLGGGVRQCGNTSKPVWWTSCTSRSAPCCLARASICSPVSTGLRTAIAAPSKCPARRSHTLC